MQSDAPQSEFCEDIQNLAQPSLPLKNFLSKRLLLFQNISSQNFFFDLDFAKMILINFGFLSITVDQRCTCTRYFTIQIYHYKTLKNGKVIA